MKKILVSTVAVVMLSACSQTGGYDGRVTKSDVGTVVGGATGAVLGAQVGKGTGRYAAIAAGTLLGAALGNSIGASLDRVDMMYHDRAAQQALETGRSGSAQTWTNPDSGNSGTITPINPHHSPVPPLFPPFSSFFDHIPLLSLDHPSLIPFHHLHSAHSPCIEPSGSACFPWTLHRLVMVRLQGQDNLVVVLCSPLTLRHRLCARTLLDSHFTD